MRFFALFDHRSDGFGVFALPVKTRVIECCIVESKREVAEFERLARYLGSNNCAPVLKRLYRVCVCCFDAPAVVFVFVGNLAVDGLYVECLYRDIRVVGYRLKCADMVVVIVRAERKFKRYFALCVAGSLFQIFYNSLFAAVVAELPARIAVALAGVDEREFPFDSMSIASEL